MSLVVVGAPCEFLIAMGHGRSYGTSSTVLGRTLPGITECGLWPALAKGSGPVHALITDIGNDVIYGAAVDTIVGWVSACVERLRAADATIVVSLPPMASIEKLTPWRFHVAKSLLFPGRRMSLPETVRRCRELAGGLVALGERHGVPVVEPEGRWYGLDPIHPRRRDMTSAWRQGLEPWAGPGSSRLPEMPSAARWARLRTLTPQQWWLLGREMGRPQPSGRLGDGSTLSLF